MASYVIYFAGVSRPADLGREGGGKVKYLHLGRLR